MFIIIEINFYLSFIEIVKKTYPQHYALFNSELFFSNMLLTDLGLREKAYKIVCYATNGTLKLISNIIISDSSNCYIQSKTIYYQKAGGSLLVNKI